MPLTLNCRHRAAETPSAAAARIGPFVDVDTRLPWRRYPRPLSPTCSRPRAHASVPPNSVGAPMLSLMIASAITVQTPLQGQWAEFRREGSLSNTTQSVQIAMDESQGTGFQYTMKFIRMVRGSKAEIRWTNSKSCPAVREVIAQMQRIPMPKLAVPGVSERDTTIFLDGSAYSLTAPSSYSMGSMTLTSVDGSPLADWMNGAFAKLSPCWRPASR